MAAGKYDFSIEQGTSFRLSVVYKDENENIIDLTNWCARLTWKTNAGVTQTFESEGADTSVYSFNIDGANGKLTLLFPFSTTNDFSFSSAKYDLELQSPDDLYTGGGKFTKRILYGTITFIKRFSSNTQGLECNV